MSRNDPHQTIHGAFYTALGLCVSTGVDHAIVGNLYYLLGIVTLVMARR